MRDLSKEDLTLFQSERPGEADQAIRLLAVRIEELTDVLDEATKALIPLAQQHKVIAETVAVLTKLHPPPPSNDEFARDPHAWGEVGIKEKP